MPQGTLMKILAGLTRLFEASSENHRGEGLRQMILACVICALAFVGAEWRMRLWGGRMNWDFILVCHEGSEQICPGLTIYGSLKSPACSCVAIKFQLHRK